MNEIFERMEKWCVLRTNDNLFFYSKHDYVGLAEIYFEVVESYKKNICVLLLGHSQLALFRFDKDEKIENNEKAKSVYFLHYSLLFDFIYLFVM